MRSMFLFAAAASLPFTAPAQAQDLGGILGGIARDALEEAVSGTQEPADSSAGSYAQAHPDAFSESWDSMRPVRFEHVIEGPPGPVTLILDGRTVDGNQTVAVYLVDRNGVRIPGWRLFVITTREGNSATGTITLPPPPEGQTIARQPVVIAVENLSGRRSRGEFALRVVPDESGGR